MRPRVRRLAVILGATAALGAARCGADTSSSSSSSQGPQSSTGTQQQSAAAQDARPGGPDLSALATKLGVSETKLRAAMEATRPSGTPGQAPSGDPATALAKRLGLSAAKVRAAMQAVGPGAGGAPGAGAPGGQPPQGDGSAPATPSSSDAQSSAA